LRPRNPPNSVVSQPGAISPVRPYPCQGGACERIEMGQDVLLERGNDEDGELDW